MSIKFAPARESATSDLAKSETNDCVVIAIMHCFDITYDEAHDWVATHMNRKFRKGTFGTKMHMENVAKSGKQHFGKKVIYLGASPKTSWTEEAKKRMLYNPDYTKKKVAYTVKTISEAFTEGTYFLLVNSHALVLKDGVILDNWGAKYSGFRRPIECAFRIID